MPDLWLNYSLIGAGVHATLMETNGRRSGGGSDQERIDTLRDALARLVADDPAIAAELRTRWRELQPHLTAAAGGVINTITGDVSGNVVQARDVQGGISFGSGKDGRGDAPHR